MHAGHRRQGQKQNSGCWFEKILTVIELQVLVLLCFTSVTSIESGRLLDLFCQVGLPPTWASASRATNSRPCPTPSRPEMKMRYAWRLLFEDSRKYEGTSFGY